MSNYDESLEIGMAAGLDPATALVISENDENKSPTPPSPGGCGCVVVLLLVSASLLAVGVSFW